MVVFGGPRHDEKVCRAPPSRGGQQSADAWRAGPRRPAPYCQEISFKVTLLSVDNPALIENAPEVSPAGTLYFKAAPQQVGTAKFRIDVADNGQVFEIGSKTLGQNNGSSRFFTLRVLETNSAPSFVVHDVFCNQKMGMQKLIFASDVRAGGECRRRAVRGSAGCGGGER